MKNFVSSIIELYPWLGVGVIFLGSRLIMLLGFCLSNSSSWVQFVLSGYRFLFNTPSPSGTLFAVHPFAIQPANHAFPDFAKFWDGFWYLDIAGYGYTYDGTTHHQSITFYPFFPWLAKWFSVPFSWLGMPADTAILAAGVVLSNVFFLAALIMLFELARQKSTTVTAWFSVALLAFYPGSLFCSLFLTEGCFLVFAVAFFLALEREQFLLAGILSWPACLTRFNGVSLLFSSVVKIGRRYIFKKPYCWLIPILVSGVLLYPLYLGWGLNDPLLYLKMHSNYRGQLPVLKLAGLLVLLAAVWLLASDDDRWRFKKHPLVIQASKIAGWTAGAAVFGFYLCSILNLLGLEGPWVKLQQVVPVHLGPVGMATAFGVILFGLYQHKLERAYKTYTILNLFPLLFAGTFFSNHRYLTLIFPLFWGLAMGLEKHPRIAGAVIAFFAVLLLGLSMLYASAGWLMIF